MIHFDGIIVCDKCEMLEYANRERYFTNDYANRDRYFTNNYAKRVNVIFQVIMLIMESSLYIMLTEKRHLLSLCIDLLLQTDCVNNFERLKVKMYCNQL